MRLLKCLVFIVLLSISVNAFAQGQGSPVAGAGKGPMVELKIGQVDTSNYPMVRIYVDIYDNDGNIVTNVDQKALQVREKDSSGKEITINIDDLYQVFQKEKISFNLVLDRSGSMQGSKMIEAKDAVLNFINEISKLNKDSIEIASFNDHVYLNQEFSADYELIKKTVQSIRTDGQTALYDAIYSALLRVEKRSGAKCVVVFTDGQENASSYSKEDVLKLAALVNTPVYIIGIGNDVAASELSYLASEMLGQYYFVDVLNLESLLSQVYADIYRRQRNRYAIQYTVPDTNDPTAPRSIEINGQNLLSLSAGSQRKYIPKANVNTSFSDTFWNNDFIFPNSSASRLTEEDLRPLSLAELRIARNEIFARHGRQFKDPMLNKWFYSKTWYLKIRQKYSPAAFNALPNQMNDTEIANVSFILKTEKDRMRTQVIFPDASKRLLSEYDVSLSKPVLKRAIGEIYKLENAAVGNKNLLSQIALMNVEKIEAALNTKDITY